MKNNLLSSFFEVAKHSPDSVAATDSKGEITFGQLFENALRFYTSVSKLHFPHKKIAIFLPNGIEALSAIISTLTAGLCYTILDPVSPSERNGVISSAGDFDNLITSKELLSEAKFFFNNDRILIYEELLKAEPVIFSVIPDVESTDGAILFYTSGSTGTPKGILHNHGNISLKLKTSSLGPDDHVDMIIPMGFVASHSLFFTLSSGVKISFFDIKKMGVVEYAAFIKKEKITHSLMTVSAFRAFAHILGENEKLESIKSLILVGEPVMPSDVNLYRKYTLPGSELYQYYGTSEIPSIAKNTFSHEGEIPEKISTGKLQPDVTVCILDELLSILPSGQTGQIAVSSPLMATEYYDNPEATKKSFIVHPQTGLLTYLTGDMGYLTEDGFLFHQGRNDFMVKVRGSRVDIMEIEDCLLKNPGVNDAVVVNKGDSFSETLLVAYCEIKNDLNINDLREYVASKLPVYMIPAFFVLIDKLPQTATGKTDRKKLSDEPLDYSVLLGKGENSQVEFDPLYQKLKTIWMEELKIPRLSPTHCFFNDLGGDSLLAVSVLERIRTEMDINLPYFILFRYRTLDKLTEYIRNEGNKMVSIDTLQLPKDEKSPVIVFVPPIKGGEGTYNFSAKSFPDNYGLFSLTYNIVDDENRYFYPLNKLMNAAAEIINQYGFNKIALFGYSMGGLLAFEIASKLQKEKVNKLILIDIPPAKKKKLNLVRFILNDFSVIAKNMRVKNFKTMKTDFDHIGLCIFYLFSTGDKIRRLEMKSHLYLAEAAHLRLYRQFDHGTYNGDMLLIRSTDTQFKFYSFGWDKFIKGTIREGTINSSHFHILENEKIDEISELVVDFVKE